MGKKIVTIAISSYLCHSRSILTDNLFIND